LSSGLEARLEAVGRRLEEQGVEVVLVLVQQGLAPVDDLVHQVEEGVVVARVRQVEHDGPPEVEPLQKRPDWMLRVARVDFLKQRLRLLGLHVVEPIQPLLSLLLHERIVEDRRQRRVGRRIRCRLCARRP